jgi:hypothetical protein
VSKVSLAASINGVEIMIAYAETEIVFSPAFYFYPEAYHFSLISFLIMF